MGIASKPTNIVSALRMKAAISRTWTKRSSEKSGVGADARVKADKIVAEAVKERKKKDSSALTQMAVGKTKAKVSMAHDKEVVRHVKKKMTNRPVAVADRRGNTRTQVVRAIRIVS
jgi:hypothetical protein